MSTERMDQLPQGLRTLLELERFHLHNLQRFQNTDRDPSFDTRYLPQNCGPIELPSFWVPERVLHVYGRCADTSDQLEVFASREQGECALFVVHPSAIGHYDTFFSKVGARNAAREGLRLWAVPTSSTRTLLVWPDRAPEQALFMKTSLHSPMFGDRRVSARKAGRSVGLSEIVLESSARLPATLAYFPEPCGIVPRLPPASGTIIRSIPKEIKDGRILVAPMFSLLGGIGGRVPLLLTMLARSDVDPVAFVDEVLCAPFARLWLEMSLVHGLILEAHAQDVMLVLSPELVPLGRFYYRDFEGLQVDWELRRHRGSPAPHGMPHDWSWQETYASWGYRYSDFLWYKWRISLLGYLHLILREIELSLREWHDRGLVHGRKCEDDELTMIFSRHLFKAIDDVFGVTMGAEYNIYRSLNRFLISLVKLRREVLGR